MKNLEEAKRCLALVWPEIIRECLSVLGSELHYQAMIYHCLRLYGQVPLSQLGMNVKLWIDEPVTDLFRALDQRKNENYRGGFEPIPDVVLFRPEIDGDWRRRNNRAALKAILIAIEVKASERKGKRLAPGEVQLDIRKLAAHRDEVREMGSEMYGVMMIIDSAREAHERMTDQAIESTRQLAQENDIGLLYCSTEREINTN